MHFIYPSDPLRPKLPDEIYADEWEAIQAVGFLASVFSFEDFQCGTFRPHPPIPSGSLVVYRGWMLSASDYESLLSALSRAGTSPLTDLPTYLLAHHLPNWYPLLADLTPETKIFPLDCDLESELRALNWPEYFIKDYVKSLKTSVGSRVSKPEEVATVLAEMRKFRGTIEGGHCVRRVENFAPNSERRFFVVDSVAHAPEGVQHHTLQGVGMVQIVGECAKRIRSRFFSVDVAQRVDGRLRVVEIGDGQVSDIVGWTAERFADVFAKHFPTQA